MVGEEKREIKKCTTKYQSITVGEKSKRKCCGTLIGILSSDNYIITY